MPGTVEEVRSPELAAADTAFAAGDTLKVALRMWSSGLTDDLRPNIHLLVGPGHPSRFTAAGLPLPGGDQVPEGAATADAPPTADAGQDGPVGPAAATE